MLELLLNHLMPTYVSFFTHWPLHTFSQIALGNAIYILCCILCYYSNLDVARQLFSAMQLPNYWLCFLHLHLTFFNSPLVFLSTSSTFLYPIPSPSTPLPTPFCCSPSPFPSSPLPLPPPLSLSLPPCLSPLLPRSSSTLQAL